MAIDRINKVISQEGSNQATVKKIDLLNLAHIEAIEYALEEVARVYALSEEYPNHNVILTYPSVKPQPLTEYLLSTQFDLMQDVSKIKETTSEKSPIIYLGFDYPKPKNKKNNSAKTEENTPIPVPDAPNTLTPLANSSENGSNELKEIFSKFRQEMFSQFRQEMQDYSHNLTQALRKEMQDFAGKLTQTVENKLTKEFNPSEQSGIRRKNGVPSLKRSYPGSEDMINSALETWAAKRVDPGEIQRRLLALTAPSYTNGATVTGTAKPRKPSETPPGLLTPLSPSFDTALEVRGPSPLTEDLGSHRALLRKRRPGTATPDANDTPPPTRDTNDTSNHFLSFFSGNKGHKGHKKAKKDHPSNDQPTQHP